MNLDPVIKSEVSQKEKNKYCITMHIHRVWKYGADEPISRAAIDAERTDCGHRGGRRGAKLREQHWHMHITTCRQELAGRCWYHGELSSALWQPRGVGWGLGGKLKTEGAYVYLWLIHIVLWQKPTQHCKEITLQLIKTNKQNC